MAIVNMSEEGINQYVAKLLNQGVDVIVASNGLLLDARGMSKITMIPTTSTDFSYSMVDSEGASAHDTKSKVDITTEAITTINVEWPFYWVSCTGANLRVAMV